MEKMLEMIIPFDDDMLRRAVQLGSMDLTKVSLNLELEYKHIIEHFGFAVVQCYKFSRGGK